jgi:carboxyl-terminal processing protease
LGKKKSKDLSKMSRTVRANTFLCACSFMVGLLLFCILLTPHTSLSHAATDDTSLVSTTTREGRLAVFDDVWETIQERYYDPAFRGIDWNSKRTTFRPAAAQAANSLEFYEVLRQMISSLKDAHTRVYSPEEKFDWWNPRFVTVGLTIREVDARPTVVKVEPKSIPDGAGIRAGDVILKIDEAPAANLIERRLQNSWILPSEDSARFRAVASLLEGPATTSVKVAWEERDGKTKSAVFQRHWTQRRLGLHFRQREKFAIIEIEAFTQTVALDFGRALPKALQGMAGIILDLRANGGGDAEAMANVASAFLGDGIDLGRFADRSGASFELRTDPKLLWPAAPLEQSKLPLVVLTSENTSSAAEILVAALRANGGARVIGRQTCGCVLAIRNRHSLPDGGILDVSEFDYRMADGLRIEGAGIPPDETIKLTRGDIYSHRDRAMESARTFLKNARGK